MDRRKFLRSGSLAGFTVPALLTAKAGESAWLPSNLAAKDNDLTEATIDECRRKCKAAFYHLRQ